ncbi:hypothetical protein JMJ35_004389 [Cladonia borealis]|uniref:Uncharacterized protein n=1 Tax=Cladonia borealis TaxID=184061 RepID=A0AA39V2F1_9LECA|nr:hypothetical protein JMJ35_004389 [Cladonia borealis]
MPPSTAPPSLPPNLTTHTQLLSPISLNASPYLPALFKLLNHCFDISHNPPGHSYLPHSSTSRLKTYTQLSEEIGPDGFTIIMLAQDTSTQAHSLSSSEERKQETVIATASAKPYTPPRPSSSNNNSSPGKKEEENNEKASELFKRQPGTDTDAALAAYAELPKWEILCMVVEPGLQGRGIAGQLMDLIIQEIEHRVRGAEKNKGGGKGEGEGEGEGEGKGMGGNGHGDEREGGKKEKTEILLLLSTLLEINQSYYQKRGWETSNIRNFPPGTMGSRDGFGVVEMMKVVRL